MKTGICPKCGTSNVHTNSNLNYVGKAGLYHQNTIPLSFWSRSKGGNAPLDNYICVDCGYVESYIEYDEKLEKIAKNWPKVESK